MSDAFHIKIRNDSSEQVCVCVAGNKWLVRCAF